jgi:hypothetical protein
MLQEVEHVVALMIPRHDTTRQDRVPRLPVDGDTQISMRIDPWAQDMAETAATGVLTPDGPSDSADSAGRR